MLKKNVQLEFNWNRLRVVNNVYLDVRNYIKEVNEIDFLFIQFDINLILEDFEECIKLFFN